jgi:hypothetical protein
MKYIHVYALFLMSVCHTSCGQNQANPPQGPVSPPVGPVWALSRYDAKSLYNKIPTVTEIKSGGRGGFWAILAANDGSIWFGSAGACIVMMERPSRILKMQPVRNNVYC